jgi:hypothetical protein
MLPPGVFRERVYDSDGFLSLSKQHFSSEVFPLVSLHASMRVMPRKIFGIIPPKRLAGSMSYAAK